MSKLTPIILAAIMLASTSLVALDWTELEEKAFNMQRKYERCFGTEACYIQKKPDGNLLKKGCK